MNLPIAELEKDFLLSSIIWEGILIASLPSFQQEGRQEEGCIDWSAGKWSAQVFALGTRRKKLGLTKAAIQNLKKLPDLFWSERGR